MAGLPSGQGSEEAPSLPPSPMSPEAVPVRPADRVLPWFTPFLTALAGAVAGLVWRHWYATFLPVPAVRYITAATALMGFGACLADRLPSRVPRPVRWGLGTAAAALVPVLGLFRQLRPTSPAALLGALPWLAPGLWYLVLLCAALGTLLGLLAGRRGSRWHMLMDAALLLGFLSALATRNDALRWLPIAADGVCGLLAGGWVPYQPVGYGNVPLLLSDALLGLLLGLAFAIGDRHAVERRAWR